ncbi:hypothetical protein HW555_004324 [Spodoptera exigua]|uniref:Uncharacterized protein n=1 Tax=Spodoptera exigua TaxID=7107 RepID=A0A835GJV6_SPOEX|nr:hypothetical protein HW555_004324 [Spodoptera exigua]
MTRSPPTILSRRVAHVSSGGGEAAACGSAPSTPPLKKTLSMKKANPYRMLLSSAPMAQMQVAATWYISHHRPPAISLFGRGRTLSGTAPQSPCGRARAPASPRQPSRRRTNTRVRERARRCTSQRCAYFGRERAPGRVGRAARALAAVLWWWCVALLRLVALCAPPPGPSPPPSARAAEDAPSAAACASAPSNTTEPSPPPEPPDPPAHTGQYTCARTPPSALPLAPPPAAPRHPPRHRCAAAVMPTLYRTNVKLRLLLTILSIS